MQSERQYLVSISQQLKQQVIKKNYDCPSSSHIVPVIIGDSQQTVDKAHSIQKAGFYVMPVRPPTVPKGGSRLRICLNANIQSADLNQLVQWL